MGKKITNEEWLKRANEKHNFKFKYPEVYQLSNIKIKIICPIHGEFTQLPNDHLSGCDCRKCVDDNQRETPENIIKRANIVHNNFYDYSNVIYINMQTDIKIICPKHGEFEQPPHRHILYKQKCPNCSKENRTKTEQNYLIQVNKKHNNYYDYSKMTYKNSYTYITIICPIHGEFSQMAKAHLVGQGCPTCSESKGEKTIREYLIHNNIEYITEKKFNGCINKKTLPFDFYLPLYNICIEYDGIQHFEAIKSMGGEKRLIDQQIKDKIKTDYCLNNNIKLIRIRYDEDIIDKLNSIFKVLYHI